MPDGALYVESDRGVIYSNQNGTWRYVAGTMHAPLASKPADLEAPDTGFLFYGEDYGHTWRWTGTAWEYAPGDRKSGELAWFAESPGIGWALCNGSVTTRTLSTAATAAFTTPDLIGRYMKGASSYTGTPVAGTTPTLSGSTATEAAHTHAVTTASVASGVGDIDSPVLTVSPGAGQGMRNEWHRHSVPGQTVTSDAGSAHSHGAGSLALSGSESPRTST